MFKETARRIGLAASLASLVAVALVASPVSARTLVQVKGLLMLDTAGVCTEDPASVATYVVTGSLTGCWYIDEWTIRNETPSGSTRATGTELFSGCIGSRCASHFSTEYSFTYKIVNGVEVHGRCHHPIVDGDGAFAGVKGNIEMHDLPDGSAEYVGQVSV
jgi:hypothetical protein